MTLFGCLGLFPVVLFHVVSVVGMGNFPIFAILIDCLFVSGQFGSSTFLLAMASASFLDWLLTKRARFIRSMVLSVVSRQINLFAVSHEENGYL